MTGTERPEQRDGDDSVAFLRCFGAQVKLFRERAGLTQAQLGTRIGYGEDLVAAVERARRIPRAEFIDKADDALEAGGVLRAMKDEVARARYPGFFRDAARLEAEAVELHAYDTHVIKGLLQTEEYARAVFGMRRPLLSEDTIEQRVAARMARQEIFSRWPAPLMSFVIEEAVLRRRIGGREVQRGQLEQLLAIGQKRNVEIQVMPLDREDHAGLSGPFTLMETDRQQRFAYVEVQNVSRLQTERTTVRGLEAQYGIIRAQALTPRESVAFIEKLLGEA
ncbi:helix-turn-helix domain-containing protein [Streptomyces sp. HB2AG]|uniref:helix-turn-helix domain-containing protein n=1 Tax=Streptomyces sp. HB2AG TaxID=2983400 RepID=UPI0022AABE3F|nr:helix-turn-helix transcriptional regulator [Streptomyces sp. HB2AG]MCZ2525375.1 helix-turn-helix transcriptional regulator [Streptomyces sp. HB2AG]